MYMWGQGKKLLGVPSNIALSSYTSRDSFENFSQPKKRSSTVGNVELGLGENGLLNGTFNEKGHTPPYLHPY